MVISQMTTSSTKSKKPLTFLKTSMSLVEGFLCSIIRPSYKKVAVNLDKMNVHPGGKQSVMRDTTANDVSSWDTERKAILEERGVNSRKMKGDMRKKLRTRKQYWRST